MIILADENIEHVLIDALSLHFQVISVYRNYRGISDLEVIKLAQTHQAIILTEDKDFGDLVFVQNQNNISVVLLRYTFTEREEICNVLIQLFKQKSFELIGKFTTVTTQKIRIRNL